MENTDNTILSLLKETTGKTDISLLEFKDLSKTNRDRIDFKKVRGSVRLMSGRVKTMADVEVMVKAFLALQIP